MAPKLPVKGTIVPGLAAPVSSASLHPSPSESISSLLGIPSPSESTSALHKIFELPFNVLFAINLTSENTLVVAPAHDKTKLYSPLDA